MTHNNPFSPSEIASGPDDFFGRVQELKNFERALAQGSVAIRGPIGIGKSSLLARGRLLMEGFDSSHKSRTVIAVGDKDIKTVDEAARLLLEAFVRVDEKTRRVTFKLGSVFESESIEICRNFTQGRHLAALKNIVEEEHLNLVLADKDMLLLAIDEADKCPIPLTRMIRSICTHTQQQGVANRVRFVVAGVSPFFQKMVDEDPGINRFFYRAITLGPMQAEEATELVETKLTEYVQGNEDSGIKLEIDPGIISRIVSLAGGHPHILQLLGSHVVENEQEDPDGLLDSRDLLESLRKICYEDRAWVYEATLHKLELYGRLESLNVLLDVMPNSFPTRIDIDAARANADEEDVAWLVEHNVLSTPEPGYYGLVDEFLRVRLLLDEASSPIEAREVEVQLVEWADTDERVLETDPSIEKDVFWRD